MLGKKLEIACFTSTYADFMTRSNQQDATWHAINFVISFGKQTRCDYLMSSFSKSMYASASSAWHFARVEDNVSIQPALAMNISKPNRISWGLRDTLGEKCFHWRCWLDVQRTTWIYDTLDGISFHTFSDLLHVNREMQRDGHRDCFWTANTFYLNDYTWDLHF